MFQRASNPALAYKNHELIVSSDFQQPEPFATQSLPDLKLARLGLYDPR
jgi:hypothetical protein